MIKRPYYGFYMGELVGSLIYLCLRDLKINNFTFHGFPEIYVVSEPKSTETENFLFEFRARGQKSELILNLLCARSIAKEYARHGKVENREAMRTVQQALINLEFAVRESE